MDMERQGDIISDETEFSEQDNRPDDVSSGNGLSEKGGIGGLFAKAGLATVKLVAAVLWGLLMGAKFILSELLDLGASLLRVLLKILKELTAPLRNRFNLNKELQKQVRRAKKQGKPEHRKALTRFWISYLFGEDGVFYTAFNYILPVVSVIFLIGVIRYGSGLEYGLSVEYNGREIGVITAEADFDAAAREVQQRIAYDESDEVINLSAKYSLKIINENDKIVSSAQLANEMLAASDEELTEAYGIYIDGKFVGAVADKEPIQDALDERLINFRTDGIVKSVSYKNAVEYSHGIYLANSVISEKAAVDMLTSSKEKKAVYVAQKDDSAVTIAQKYNMELDELEELNPGIQEKCRRGKLVNVVETESFLPIQYVREMELITFMDYETMEVETSSLNIGVTDILVKGERGEKTSNIEIIYVDGKEYSRKTVSAKVTKQPVMEQVGIGVYAARPDSPDTKLYGSGQFGWPVDGGWISDPFISNRNHKGLDIAAPGGTDIYAAADGIVISAGWNTGGYGYFVEIGHEDGYQTVYAHMSVVYAVEGMEVSRGQLIGAVGTTGNSTGNHCHFEVRYMGICRDPAMFLNTVEGYDPYDERDKDER